MQDAHALCVKGQEGRYAEQLILLLFVLTWILPASASYGPV